MKYFIRMLKFFKRLVATYPACPILRGDFGPLRISNRDKSAQGSATAHFAPRPTPRFALPLPLICSAQISRRGKAKIKISTSSSSQFSAYQRIEAT